MAKRKVVTSRVEVFRVKGETIEIAFNNFKQEHSLDNHHLTISDTLEKEHISTGSILLKSKALHRQYITNTISEYSVYGALYNYKPVIKDEGRILEHNVVNRGTKKWITVNEYITDSGEVIEIDTGTKEEIKPRSRELAAERNETINVQVGKKLENGDGILYISEYIPVGTIDDTNVYIFWIFKTEITEVEEDDLIQENTSTDDVGQLSIKDDLTTYIGRQTLLK